MFSTVDGVCELGDVSNSGRDVRCRPAGKRALTAPRVSHRRLVVVRRRIVTDNKNEPQQFQRLV